MREHIRLGRWTEETLSNLLHESSRIGDAGRRIDFLSSQLLHTPYRESTLTGDINTPEVLVIDLGAVDCFTFIDYVEAMRISLSFEEFRENLMKVRYREGVISFENRNHFFTDWKESNPDLVEDVTEMISAGRSKRVVKKLNEKDDDTCFIAGLKCMKRDLAFISAEAIDDAVIDSLQTGDYAGLYSNKPGLDVSHVGIIVKKQDAVYMRHASSAIRHGKVVDEIFRNYIADKPGLIILRPKHC